MYCIYSIICWSNTKIFLSILIVFGKYFCIEKFQKIQKFSTLLFGDLLMSYASRELTQKFLRLPGKWDLQSQKILRNCFKKFWGFVIFATHFHYLVVSGSLVVSLLEEVRDLLASGCPSRKKDLDKIFKILYKGFWWLVLATCSWVIWVAKNACFAQIGLNLKQFFKKLFSFPRITCITLCLLHLSLSQNCYFYSQNLHFLLQSPPNLQEKVLVFSYFHSISSL